VAIEDVDGGYAGPEDVSSCLEFTQGVLMEISFSLYLYQEAITAVWLSFDIWIRALFGLNY